MDNASQATTPPPGWHPDPLVAGHMRWWSGMQWTEHTQPAAAPPSAPAQAPFPVAGQPITQHAVAQPAAAATAYQPTDPRDAQIAPSDPAAMDFASRSESIVQKNPSSFFAIGIAATYIVIALYTGFVFFGVMPAYFGFKAFSNREKLAPLAIIAAGIAIAFAITARNNAQ